MLESSMLFERMPLHGSATTEICLGSRDIHSFSSSELVDVKGSATESKCHSGNDASLRRQTRENSRYYERQHESLPIYQDTCRAYVTFLFVI